MSKKITVGTSVVLMLLAALVTFQLTFIGINNKYKAELNELTASMETFKKLAAVDSIYRSLYVGEIDETELSDYTIRGYIAGTGDKYAYYLDREQFAEMLADTAAEMQGIGVYIIMTDNVIEIISVLPDSPALKAGIQPGDLVVYVDGESVAELGYNNAVRRLQGKAGTVAEFTVYRNGEYIDFSIERGYVIEQTVSYRTLESDPTVGIVKILSFDLGTPVQFKGACEALIANGAKRLIFDVRYNPGGEISSICEVLDYLLPEGPIVRIVDAAGNETVHSSDKNELDVPMAVLINKRTASAAELFAAALQDYDKAELVGTVTYGKGTVQRLISLSDGTGIAISYSMYYPPFSDCYEDVGVQPDHLCEMDKKFANVSIYKIADKDDTQLQKAIEVLNAAE